jgi:polysaccharide chain length determinant protein (PEP-CTERM system associated)
MTDLDLEVTTDLEKEDFLTDMRESISLSGDRTNASLYSISVQNKSRDTARDITQALITVFIESSLSTKREDSSGAQDFLDQQIAEYEVRLVEAEDRLAAFKQRYVGTLPGESGGYYARLGQAKEDLSTAQLQLKEMENRRTALEQQIDGEVPVFLSSTGGVIESPLDDRMRILNARLDELLARYTERHPEVRQLQSLIDDLKDERTAELSLAQAGGYSESYSGLNSSPVYQGMRSMLAETQANVAELLVRVAEYENRVKELDERVDNLPLIEVELKQLDRGYQVISAQHRELLERRETARLSQDVERNASDVAFRVVDPPFVPTKPSEPNKLLLNSMVLFAALGAGAGLALLVSLIKPVIVDPRSLTALTGLPLLGTVSFIPTPEQKRHSTIGLLVFSSMLLVLLGAFAGLNIGQALMMA